MTAILPNATVALVDAEGNATRPLQHFFASIPADPPETPLVDPETGLPTRAFLLFMADLDVPISASVAVVDPETMTPTRPFYLALQGLT